MGVDFRWCSVCDEICNSSNVMNYDIKNQKKCLSICDWCREELEENDCITIEEDDNADEGFVVTILKRFKVFKKVKSYIDAKN